MAGIELDGLDEVALMVNVADPELAVASASRGYLRLMGLTSHEVLGRGLQQLLTTGAPLHAVSKSANHDMIDFCRQCSLPTVEDIGETVVVQPTIRADGTQLTVLSLLGLCRIHERPYALVVQAPLGEGVAVRVSVKTRQGLIEQCRQTLLRLRKQLCIQGPSGPVQVASDARCPAFGFFRDRLQAHCVLSNGSLTATRREKDELQNGCLVFSDRPIPMSEEGLEFSLKIDSIAAGFEGLPLLGFTRRQPKDTPDLYPVVSNCLGESVLVGGQGRKAYARDKYEHFVMGFKLPPQHEVQTWPAQDSQPIKLRAGDIVKCIYTMDGTIQFLLNDKVVLDFDVERPVQHGARYYAVVDVCFTAGGMTALPGEVAPMMPDMAPSQECFRELTVDALEEIAQTCSPDKLEEHEQDQDLDQDQDLEQDFEQDLEQDDEECDSPMPIRHRRSTKRRPTTASMASTVASEADLMDFSSDTSIADLLNSESSDDCFGKKTRTCAMDFPTEDVDGKLGEWEASAPSSTTSSRTLRAYSVAAVALGSCAMALALGKRLK